MPQISTEDAAKRLGVSPRRVRALAGQGRLPGKKLGSIWLFDSNLLSDHVKTSASSGRPFSPQHALGLLYLASDEDPEWLSDYEKWRLRRYDLPRLRELLPRLRTRARVEFWHAPQVALRPISKDGVRSGVSAAIEYGADIAARDFLDVYCLASYGRLLVHRYALSRAPEAAANLVLRSVSNDAPLVGRRVMPKAVVGCDLLDSADERTKRAGRRLLDKIVS